MALPIGSSSNASFTAQLAQSTPKASFTEKLAQQTPKVSFTEQLAQNTPEVSNTEKLLRENQEGKEEISSGQRINEAADDVAGIQLANRLTAEINEQSQRIAGAQDQANVKQVQSARFSAISDSLSRANTLSIQAGNPLSDRSAIQNELNQITEQVNTIAGEALGDSEFLAQLNAQDPSGAQSAIASATEAVNSSATQLGAASSGLDAQVRIYQSVRSNTLSSRSAVADTNIAEATQEQQQAGVLLNAALITRQDEETRKGLLVNQLV